MTQLTRIARAFQGMVVGGVAGAIAAVLILLVSLATYGLLTLPLYETYVLPLVVLAGGFLGAAIGLAIGLVLYKTDANIGLLHIGAWMALGALAAVAVLALFELVTHCSMRSADNAVEDWFVIAFLSVYGAALGPVVGVLLAPRSMARRVVLGLILVGVGLAIVYVVWGAIATNADRIDTEALGPVHCVAVSADGRRIVSGHQDGTVRVWDADTGALLHRFGFDRCSVLAVACSPNDRQIAFVLSDTPVIQIWDLQTNQPIQRFIGHDKDVTTIAFSSDGRLLLSGSRDQTVPVWDADKGTQLHCCKGHQADVNSVCISSDGRLVVSGGGDYWGGVQNDPSVRLWDTRSGRELPHSTERPMLQGAWRFSPDDRYIASAGWDKGIQVWDVKAGKLVRQFGNRYMNCVAFTTDGKRIISGDGHGNVGLWDLELGERIFQMHGSTGEIWGIAVMPDGKRVVTCSGSWAYADRQVFGWFVQPDAIPLGDSIRIWDLETGEEIRELNLAEK